MRGNCCRKVRASVESSSSELVVGGSGGSSIERFIDHLVVTAEFLLQNIRPAAIRRITFTGTALIRDEAPRKGIAEDHDSDWLSKAGTDECQYRDQTKELFHVFQEGYEHIGSF